MTSSARWCSHAHALRAVPSVYCHSRKRWACTDASRSHDPLKILFCGADTFSIHALRELRTLQIGRPEKIASIDVLCRPDKLVGRGLKESRELPIKACARELGLPIWQVDTFKGWSPPHAINLIIAVSFGLLVPARLLNDARYGGLNVHPSLLPDLRGPAPILHTLLKQRSHTGVTLQTMHPTKFDHGIILDQTRGPGIEVPPDCTPDKLLDSLSPIGGKMLKSGIENALFLNPTAKIEETTNYSEGPQHAPKITPEDRHIDWQTWSSTDIVLRDRVLGKLWDTQTFSQCASQEDKSVSKRVVFGGPWEISSRKVEPNGLSPGGAKVTEDEHSNRKRVYILASDHILVTPTFATIEGGKKDTGIQTLVGMHSKK